MTAAQSIEKVKAPDDIWCPIFKAGLVGGREWTEHDLRTMEGNGKRLAGRLTIPITPGHNVLIGAHESAQPAIGIVSDLKVREGKLWARMSKIEPYAKALAKDGRYLSVSAEIVGDIRTSPSGVGLEDTGAAGPAVVGLAWLGKHRGRVKDLPSLAALYNSEPGRDAIEDVDSIAALDRHIEAFARVEAKYGADAEEKVLSNNANERLDALERRFAELLKIRAANEAALRGFAADPIRAPEPRRAERREPLPRRNPNPMTYDRTLLARFAADSRPTKEVFRSAVDDRVAANGGDLNDPAARLKAAQDLIRELADVGEVTVAPADYLHALKTQTELAQGSAGGWGYDRPVGTKQQAGSLGGQQPRVPVTTVFGEDAEEEEAPLYGPASMRAVNELVEFAETPKAPKTSTEAHQDADVLAAEHPELVAGYTGRAKVRPLPDAIMERMHHELGKIPVDQKDRLGIATRRAVASLPSSAPTYGWTR